jgi:outer membrane protein assembly factor BamA
MKHLCICFLLFCSAHFCHAQKDKLVIDTSIAPSTDTIQYIVGSIKLSGNKKTKNYIIFREVTFKEGQPFPPHELTKALELTRQQIMNTALFVDVTVYASSLKNGIVDINIDVKERWYLFPLPYFKLVDRNFNQWLTEQKASLDRVNYGLKFFYNNASGRNDKVSLDLVNGYNQQISFGYSQPFADKTLTRGFNMNFNYNRQREMNYATVGNKQGFYKQSDFVRETKRGSVAYTFRPDSKYRYYIRAGYTYDKVEDTILKLNPQFLPNQKTSIGFFDLGAGMQYFKLDYIPFPQKGFSCEVGISNRGFNKTMNMFALNMETLNAVTIAKGTFVQFHNLAVVKLPFDQPFYNAGLLGYGDVYLRGLENYVMDGSLGVLSNTTLYKKLFTYVFKNPLKSKTHDKIPFTFYLKAFGDMGYAYNKNKIGNSLSNTFLRTTGIGLDVVSIYDFVFRIEYSFNQLGDRGFAFRTKGDF